MFVKKQLRRWKILSKLIIIKSWRPQKIKGKYDEVIETYKKLCSLIRECVNLIGCSQNQLLKDLGLKYEKDELKII